MILPKELTTVTTFSKTLAMMLFILFPFVGFFFGIKYQLMIDNQAVQKQTQKIITPVNIVSPTLLVNTSNWKSYTNPQFNYSFKLPRSYSVSYNTPAPTENYILQSMNMSERSASGGKNDLIFTVQSASSLVEGIRNTQKQTTLSNKQLHTINNLNWQSYNSETNYGEAIYFTFIKNRLYTIDGRNNDLIKNVLNTFQLTK